MSAVKQLMCPNCEASAADICGIEVRGVYDGVLFWICDLCGLAWSRDWRHYERRSSIAEQMVGQINAERGCDLCGEPKRYETAICTACAENIRDDNGADVGWGS